MIDKACLAGDNYLFRRLKQEVNAFRHSHPDVDLIDMGIGDVICPVAPVVEAAMQSAASEMAQVAAFRGYPPVEGRAFARDAVAKRYQALGIVIGRYHVAVGSGAKDELAVWSRVLSADVPALICRPYYPAYVDVNRLVGRRVVYADCRADLHLPMPYDVPTGQYVIYLCSPHNPTGQIYTLDELQQWVDYANATKSVILFDAAYAEYAAPYSVLLCRGAERCCIEIGTLSKSASFSGLRFGWSVVGKACWDGLAFDAYCRYKSVNTNGIPYVIERAGEAALSSAGMAYSRRLLDRYRLCAEMIGTTLREWGVTCSIGPYLWVHLPMPLNAARLLHEVHIVVTPGEGFGGSAEYVRMSVFALGNREQEVLDRLRPLISNR